MRRDEHKWELNEPINKVTNHPFEIHKPFVKPFNGDKLFTRTGGSYVRAWRKVIREMSEGWPNCF